MVAIGGYNLKKIKEFEGTEGYGLNAELYKGKKLIAYVRDSGYGGGMEVHFANDVREDKETQDEVLKDMTTLIDAVHNGNKEVSWYIETFKKTSYSACEGFTELLLVLRGYEKLAKRLFTKIKKVNLEDTATYYVYEENSCYFIDNKNYDKTMSASVLDLDGTVDVNQALEKLIKDSKESGIEITGGIMIKGKPNLNLSFEEYAKIYNRFLQTAK